MGNFKIAEWLYFYLYCPNSCVAYSKHLSQIDFSFLSNWKKYNLKLPPRFRLFQKLESLSDEQSILLSFFVGEEIFRCLRINPNRKQYNILIRYKIPDIKSDFSNIASLKLYRMFPNAWVKNRTSEAEISFRLLDLQIDAYYNLKDKDFQRGAYKLCKEIPPPSEFLKQNPCLEIKAFQSVFASELESQQDYDYLEKVISDKITLRNFQILGKNFGIESYLDLWILNV